MPTLSVVLNTKNSAQYLRECLASVQSIADEIVIVDMNSDDDTLKIADYFGAKVYQYENPEVGFADPARQFLFDKATSDWLLMLDSDEIISTDLAILIKKIVDQNGSNVDDIKAADVYFIARSNIIFGRTLTNTGWFPDYQVRLWKKDYLTWQPTVHSVPEISGTTAYLPARGNLSIIHHNYQTITQFLARENKYTDFQVEKIASVDFSAESFLSSFTGEFWRRFFQSEGHRDGNHGLVLSLLQAHYELVALAKKWQEHSFAHQEITPKQIKTMTKKIKQELGYWHADYQIKNTHGLNKLYWRAIRKLNS